MTPEYVGDQPEGCRQCGRGYRDGSGGWWCCGDGYSWMQVRNGKLVVNARQYRNGQPYGPIRLIDPEHYVEDILPEKEK